MQQRRSVTGRLFGFIAMGLVLLTTGQAQAQTTANGPYYATPSWDQTLPAATRFIILSNFNSAAVLDRNTGLVWEKSPGSAPQSWSNARLSCINRVIGSQKGWRLPAIAELASLVDPSVAFPGPTLPPGHPFTGVQPGLYWSATLLADSPFNPWGVDFIRGDVDAFSSTGMRVWCVRGGSNADAY